MAPQLRELSEEAILEFISEKVRESKAKGVVVGLSGGIDSAVTSLLCAKALGPDKVLNIFLPSRSTPSGDKEDVEAFCRHFGMELRTLDISAMVDALRKTLPGFEDKKADGQRHSPPTDDRALPSRQDAGPGGHGDEQQVRAANRLLHQVRGRGRGLLSARGPLQDRGAGSWQAGSMCRRPILDKVPTAGLWEGQTDEGEMGLTYEELDQILVGIELNLSNEDIASRTKIQLEKVEKVWAMHRATVHKRKTPLIPKIGLRTVGLDWRE